MSVIHVITGQAKILLAAVLAPDRGLSTTTEVAVLAITLSPDFISCNKHIYIGSGSE